MLKYLTYFLLLSSSLAWKRSYYPTTSPPVVGRPTLRPTPTPTLRPPVVGVPGTTLEPTIDPTLEPTIDPTIDPTLEPTFPPLKCNTCSKPFTLFNEGCCGGFFTMVTTPCVFEIKYKFTFPPTQECGTIGFMNPTNGYEDYIIHCNTTSLDWSVQQLGIDGDYVDAVIPNLAEVECGNQTLTFDMYMNVAENKGLNLTNYIIDDEGKRLYMSLVI